MTKNTQKIEIEIPVYDGYEYVRYGVPQSGDYISMTSSTEGIKLTKVFGDKEYLLEYLIYRPLPEFPGYKYLGYRIPEKNHVIYVSLSARIISAAFAELTTKFHVFEKIAPKETILKWLPIRERGLYSSMFPLSACKILICGEDTRKVQLFWRTSPEGMFNDFENNLISHLNDQDRQYFAVVEEF